MKQNDWINLLAVLTPPAMPGRPNGIVFDNISFTEPAHLDLFLLPFGRGGLYAIMVPDSTAKPRPYRVIYFGQAGELQKRVRKSHEGYADWISEAGSAWQLYVSFHAMTGNEEERVAIESRLIAKYKPVCNEVFNPFYGGLGRLLGGK
jgi:hypothetical protein